MTLPQFNLWPLHYYRLPCSTFGLYMTIDLPGLTFGLVWLYLNSTFGLYITIYYLVQPLVLDDFTSNQPLALHYHRFTWFNLWPWMTLPQFNLWPLHYYRLPGTTFGLGWHYLNSNFALYITIDYLVQPLAFDDIASIQLLAFLYV